MTPSAERVRSGSVQKLYLYFQTIANASTVETSCRPVQLHCISIACPHRCLHNVNTSCFYSITREQKTRSPMTFSINQLGIEVAICCCNHVFHFVSVAHPYRMNHCKIQNSLSNYIIVYFVRSEAVCSFRRAVSPAK